jgi:cytochrome b561
LRATKSPTPQEENAVPSEHYHAVAIWIHWLVALLIVAVFLVGLNVDNFPKDWTRAVVNLHAIAGLAILALTFARAGWRMGHAPPAYPANIGPATRRLSHQVHMILYVLMVVVPVVGIPALLLRARGLDFGIFTIPSPFARDPSLFRPLTQIHKWTSFALIGLAGGHLLAALYHQFVRKDAIIRRMLPA